MQSLQMDWSCYQDGALPEGFQCKMYLFRKEGRLLMKPMPQASGNIIECARPNMCCGGTVATDVAPPGFQIKRAEVRNYLSPVHPTVYESRWAPGVPEVNSMAAV